VGGTAGLKSRAVFVGRRAGHAPDYASGV
jgi:hypothetical protein